MNNLSTLRVRRAQYEEAERLERSLLEERQRVVGDEAVGVAINLGNLGTALAHRGKHAEAEEGVPEIAGHAPEVAGTEPRAHCQRDEKRRADPVAARRSC